MTDPMFDLTGKVALVTGGSRGLGRAMVDAFAERGADLIVASRKADACEEAAREAAARFGVTALPVACNVSSWTDCDALTDYAYSKFGRVDVLVNNAGMSPLHASLDQVSEALWDKVIAVNLKGPFRLTAVIGSRMAAAAGGSIINVLGRGETTESARVAVCRREGGAQHADPGLRPSLRPDSSGERHPGGTLPH